MSKPAPRRMPPSFRSLLNKYPEVSAPCDQPWQNQCAIRLSIALEGAGFPLTGYVDPLCKHGHARGAESLATYFWRQVSPPIVIASSTRARSFTRGRTGIVFFRNIEGFRGGRGDHIDLWDRSATITGEFFERAQETWFWGLT